MCRSQLVKSRVRCILLPRQQVWSDAEWVAMRDERTPSVESM